MNIKFADFKEDNSHYENNAIYIGEHIAQINKMFGLENEVDGTDRPIKTERVFCWENKTYVIFEGHKGIGADYYRYKYYIQELNASETISVFTAIINFHIIRNLEANQAIEQIKKNIFHMAEKFQNENEEDEE